MLWGVVMALLAIVPVLGAFVVWIPAALFLLVGALALRLRLRTGQRNSWLYAGPVVAVVALVCMVLNLRGHVFRGA